MTSPSIEIATERDIEPIIDSMLLAFCADPVARWTYPQPQHYLKHFPNLLRAFSDKAFQCNTAYYVADYSGAALWYPPTIEPDAEAMVALLQQTAGDRDLEELFAVLEQMGSYHPSEPHWYLAVLGVEPLQQGKGYGSALIQEVLALCDREQKIAYLEASKPATVPFYERHGFEKLGPIQVGMSPPIIPMVRQPQ